MEEARKRELVAEVSNGSGWPPGGPFLQPEDGFLSLEFGTVTVSGGKKLRITPARLNDYIGKAKNGDKGYSQFKGRENQLMSAGLIRPVVIRQ